MAIKTVDELKMFLMSGKKPTQQQFWDLLESYVHKNDGIAIVNVTGLVNALNGKLDKTTFDAYEQGGLIEYNGDATFAISAGTVLERIIPCYGADGFMRISQVANGSEDILSEVLISAGWQQPIEINRVFENAATIYINGVAAASKLLFMTRKFKKNV